MRVLWQLGTCWPPAPQPSRLPRSQGWETASSQRWGLSGAVAGLRRSPLFCPQGPQGELWFLGRFSAWPADLKQMFASRRASISSCVRWGNSSTRRGGTPRETIHLKLLAEFTPSGAVCPGVPTPGSHWAEGFQLLQALEEQEGLPGSPHPSQQSPFWVGSHLSGLGLAAPVSVGASRSYRVRLRGLTLVPLVGWGVQAVLARTGRGVGMCGRG